MNSYINSSTHSKYKINGPPSLLCKEIPLLFLPLSLCAISFQLLMSNIFLSSLILGVFRRPSYRTNLSIQRLHTLKLNCDRKVIHTHTLKSTAHTITIDFSSFFPLFLSSCHCTLVLCTWSSVPLSRTRDSTRGRLRQAAFL